MKKQKTQFKKGEIYQCLDSSNDVTKSAYYIVTEVDRKKGEAKILVINRTEDILDDGVQRFQPLDYVKGFNDEPLTVKIKHLEKLNLKEVK